MTEEERKRIVSIYLESREFAKKMDEVMKAQQQAMGGSPRMGLTLPGSGATLLRANRLPDGRIHVFSTLRKKPEVAGTGFILEPGDILTLVNDLLQARAEHLDATPKPDNDAPAGN